MAQEVRRADTQPNFTSLPLDLLIALMDYLKPLDLIALRRTCRALYDASQQRIVWIKALEDICASNNVFLPTFQLDQMSTISLSQVATAPAKWMSALGKNRHQRMRDPNLKAYAEIPQGPRAPDRSPISFSLSSASEVQKIFLVPGGRFLLLLTLFELHLWDLEQTRSAPGDGMTARTQPLASAVMNHQYNITFSAQPTKDGMGMRVVVASYPRSSITNKRKQIVVYEIWPLSLQPEFVEIATLGTNSVAPTFSLRLAGDRLVFLDGRVVKIWDFVSGLWAEWDTQKHFHNNIVLTSDAVLLLNHEETVVWKIPELKPLDQEPAPSSGDNMISLPSLLVLNGEHMKLAYWGALDDWYWDKQEYFFDAFIVDERKNMLNLVRYNLSPTSTTKVSQSITPIKPPISFRFGTGGYSLQYRYCEGNLLACAISADAQFAQLAILGGKPKDYAHVLVELHHDMNSVLDYSVCPVSGRICYATEENGIEVVDLFRSIC